MSTWVRDHVTYMDDEVRITPIYKCDACGREWDGQSQCFPCDQEEEEEEESEPPLPKRIKILRKEDVELDDRGLFSDKVRDKTKKLKSEKE